MCDKVVDEVTIRSRVRSRLRQVVQVLENVGAIGTRIEMSEVDG